MAQRKKIESKNDMDRLFPDKQFSNAQLREWEKAIEKAGDVITWMASKGIVRVEGGRVIVLEYENIKHREVLKGSNIHYNSNVPFDFWNEAIMWLNKYQFGKGKGKQRELEALEEMASKEITKKSTKLF